MSIELLRSLSQRTLPATLTKPDEIEQARSLTSSGCIAAVFSAPDNADPFARVLAITLDGRTVLAIVAARGRRSK
nr:hypothetical protein [Variovorax boronicumulans]